MNSVPASPPTAAPPFLTAGALGADGAAHGFFSRAGGVSTGDYTSLNTGPGSADDTRAVAENRRRCAAILAVDEGHLLTGYQTHSADVIAVEGPWRGPAARADGLATRTPGLAIGVLTADCMPILFLDRQARVVAAAHAGWRGALAGVLENTIAAMERLGADPAHIRAAVGPCLRQPNFEIGLDLLDVFLAKHPESECFFAPGVNDDKRQLDLVGYGAWRLRNAGMEKLEDLGVCTLAEPDRYFSYRAARRAGCANYGRNLSAIALQ